MSATPLRSVERASTATRRRVAFVLHVMQVAGAEVLVYETIRRLADRIDPCVLCLDRVGPLGETLQREGVPVIAFDRRPGIDWRLFGRIASTLRERRIDVVHAHQYTPFFYASAAALLSGRRPRVIFTEHGRHYPDVVSWKRRLANRWCLSRMADEVTAVCGFSADSLASKDGFSRDRIAVIPNGIDLARYAPIADRAGLRRRLGLDPTRRYVVIVARFHPVKDHAMLLTAFQPIAAARPDVDLLLVGDGPLRADIEAQAAAAGLTRRVVLLGVRSDVEDILRAADVFALSSVSEAASITLLEAMACGLPVVVTAVGGNPEIVRDGVDGLLVARSDAGGMSAALDRLLETPAERAEMGAAGSARVRELFQMDQTIQRYEALYAR